MCSTRMLAFSLLLLFSLAACGGAALASPTAEATLESTATQLPTQTLSPVIQDDLTFESGDITLTGRLDLPGVEGPYPAVVWVHGSGQRHRDDAQAITDALVGSGFAVLR